MTREDARGGRAGGVHLPAQLRHLPHQVIPQLQAPAEAVQHHCKTEEKADADGTAPERTGLEAAGTPGTGDCGGRGTARGVGFFFRISI